LRAAQPPEGALVLGQQQTTGSPNRAKESLPWDDGAIKSAVSVRQSRPVPESQGAGECGREQMMKVGCLENQQVALK